MRRSISASAGDLPKVGLPAKVEWELAATLSVARLQASTRDGSRPLEPNCGNIVGAFIIRLIGAVLLEANDEWQLQHRYMQTEAMAELTPPLLDAAPTPMSTQAA